MRNLQSSVATVLVFILAGCQESSRRLPRYLNEQQWLVGEIARSVAAMALYASTKTLPPTVSITPTVRELPHLRSDQRSFDFYFADKTLPGGHRIEISDYIWSPRDYAGLATGILAPRPPSRWMLSGRLPPHAEPPETGWPQMLTELLDLRVKTLKAQSDRISAALASNMSDPHLHEEAAFLVGAFALREAAGD